MSQACEVSTRTGDRNEREKSYDKCDELSVTERSDYYDACLQFHNCNDVFVQDWFVTLTYESIQSSNHGSCPSSTNKLVT